LKKSANFVKNDIFILTFMQILQKLNSNHFGYIIYRHQISHFLHSSIRRGFANTGQNEVICFKGHHLNVSGFLIIFIIQSQRTDPHIPVSE
jgi:hypothetical protein